LDKTYAQTFAVTFTSTTTESSAATPTGCAAYDAEHETTLCSSYGPTYTANGKTYSITCDAAVNSGNWVGDSQADKGTLDLAQCINWCAEDDDQHSDYPCTSATYDNSNPDFDLCTLWGDAGYGVSTGVCGSAAIVPYVVSHSFETIISMLIVERHP
jgi:hypothetical protein